MQCKQEQWEKYHVHRAKRAKTSKTIVRVSHNSSFYSPKWVPRIIRNGPVPPGKHPTRPGVALFSCLYRTVWLQPTCRVATLQQLVISVCMSSYEVSDLAENNRIAWNSFYDLCDRGLMRMALMLLPQLPGGSSVCVCVHVCACVCRWDSQSICTMILSPLNLQKNGFRSWTQLDPSGSLRVLRCGHETINDQSVDSWNAMFSDTLLQTCMLHSIVSRMPRMLPLRLPPSKWHLPVKSRI